MLDFPLFFLRLIRELLNVEEELESLGEPPEEQGLPKRGLGQW